MSAEKTQLITYGPQPRPRRMPYWADVVTPQGKVTIDHLRRTLSQSYSMYAADGFRAVDDIPEQKRGVMLDLNDYQRRIVREWAVKKRIQDLEAEDMRRGREQEYIAIEGALRPRSGRRWRDIAEKEHVRVDKNGVTILAREKESIQTRTYNAAVALDATDLIRLFSPTPEFVYT